MGEEDGGHENDTWINELLTEIIELIIFDPHVFVQMVTSL